MSLKVIGNATTDTILRMDGPIRSGLSNSVRFIEMRRGGVYNIARHLTVEHELFMTDLSPAVIILNLEKTSFVDWKRQIITHSVYPFSTWTHISYLDKLDIDMESLNTDVVSADLCDPDRDDQELLQRLQHVDYLTISKKELIAEAHVKAVKQAVIVRNRDKVVVYRCADSSMLTYSVPAFPDLENPVGAGDSFTAELLNRVAGIGYPTNEAELFTECVTASIKNMEAMNAAI